MCQEKANFLINDGCEEGVVPILFFILNGGGLLSCQKLYSWQIMEQASNNYTTTPKAWYFLIVKRENVNADPSY